MHRSKDIPKTWLPSRLGGLLFLLVLVLVIPEGWAQTHWSEGMARGHATFADTREAFEAAQPSFPETRSCGEKPFRRWAWWMEERGAASTEIPPTAWWEQTASRRSTLVLNNAATSQAVWRYIGPVEDDDVPVHGGAGRINALEVLEGLPDTWWACAPAGGLWRSENAGESWSVFGIDALAPLGASDVWVNPDNAEHVWLATGDGNGGDTYSIGVLETLDGGQTWQPLELAFSPDQGRRIYKVDRHPTLDHVFWVATDLGLFVSEDSGSTFDLRSSGNVRDFVWMSDSIAVLAVQNEGLLRTVDAGQTWGEVILPEDLASIGRIQVAAESFGEAGTRDTVYAVAGHYFQQNFLGLWRSTDAGLTWEALATRESGPNMLGYTISGADFAGQAFWDLCLEVDPQNAQHVVVGGVNVWESTDGGVHWNCPLHWQGADEALYTHADQHDLVFLPNGDLLIANDGGVFQWRTSSTCEDKSAGLQITQGYALGLDALNPAQYLVGTQDNGTFYATPHATSRILDGDGFHCFVDTAVADRLYASAYYGLLYRSDDGGRSMTGIADYFQPSGPNELGAWQTPFQLHPGVPGRIVAAKKSLHFSDDGGDSWETWDGMGTVRSTALALHPVETEVALVAKNSALYWKGIGSGDFVSVPGLPGHHIGDVAISRENPLTWMVAFADYEENAQVWRTEDAGAHWDNISSGLPALPVHRLLELDNGDWWVGSDMGVHKWDQEQNEWEDMGTGLPLAPVVDLVQDLLLNRVVASTYGRGIWAVGLEDAPAAKGVVVGLDAPSTQCLNMLQGTPWIHNAGTDTLWAVPLEVIAESPWSGLATTTMVASFPQGLAPGTQGQGGGFLLEVPFVGEALVRIQPLNSEGEAHGDAYPTTLWSSGLGHTMTMTWWADCENVDMSWDLFRDDTPSNALLASIPLAAGDTLETQWCLSQGCHSFVWTDQGGDGFSGEDCGEPGGFVLRGPFGEVVHQAEEISFDPTITFDFCIELPWCYADYNGDGNHTVNDLLALLSEFGCPFDCFTDNSFDGAVTVEDLMNMLTVYGTPCVVDP